MKYYIELKTYPNPDFTSRKIIEDVFGRLHFIFASIHFEKKAVPIGVSFPQYTVKVGEWSVGSVIRLFAENKHDLAVFSLSDGLKGFSDYISVSRVQQVPDTVTGYSNYYRKGEHSSIDSPSVLRRYAKRHNISFKDASILFADAPQESNSLPYIMLRSNSTKQRYPFIIQKRLREHHEVGTFNNFGLSSTTTVPEF